MKLKLTPHYARFFRNEIHVEQDGVPVPFVWSGPLEIEVDDCFSGVEIVIKRLPEDQRADVSTSKF